MLLCSIPAAAQEGSQAHDILLKTLALIQNPGGIQLDYHLRVTFYTKKGHIIFKGDKFRRESKKTIDWFDGTTFWTLNKSSKVCKIQRPKKQTDQNLASMMNSARTDCVYKLNDEGHLWRINVKSKVKGAKVKEAEVLVNKATYAPAQLRIRFGLIWATITLSNFKAANYDDSNFHFDPHKYPGVKIVDKL